MQKQKLGRAFIYCSQENGKHYFLARREDEKRLCPNSPVDQNEGETGSSILEMILIIILMRLRFQFGIPATGDNRQIEIVINQIVKV